MQIDGYSRNRDLFTAHRNFAKYLPLISVGMYPGLFQRAKETITNMTRADYLHLISYPNYSGYRVEHDPVYTIYFTQPHCQQTSTQADACIQEEVLRNRNHHSWSSHRPHCQLSSIHSIFKVPLKTCTQSPFKLNA